MPGLHGDHPWYSLWLYPSIASFTLSSLLILNVLFTPRLRNQYFHRLSALLAVTDLLQSGAWYEDDPPLSIFSLPPHVSCIIGSLATNIASLITTALYKNIFSNSVPYQKHLSL
jgi:hypothetical protein